jgi:hypothetical protein
MKGHDDVIELLNDVLTAELTAINQYFVDAKMFQNWGYERLGKRFRDESIDEMHDADKLIERILYLDPPEPAAPRRRPCRRDRSRSCNSHSISSESDRSSQPRHRQMCRAGRQRQS